MEEQKELAKELIEAVAFPNDFEKGALGSGVGPVAQHKELTTNEIFQESMKLSGPAYSEKGEKLVEYQAWLKRKWILVDNNIQEQVKKEDRTLSFPSSGATRSNLD